MRTIANYVREMRADWKRINPEPVTDDVILRGQHAERLLNDPILAMVFDLVERDLTATWRNSTLGQKDQREEAYRLIWALAQVKTKLQSVLADKKMLEAEHDRLRREQERRAA